MQHNISGLEPSTKYEFLLAGVNIAGTGEQVKVEEFTSVETGNKVPFLPTKQVPSTIDALTAFVLSKEICQRARSGSIGNLVP